MRKTLVAGIVGLGSLAACGGGEERAARIEEKANFARTVIEQGEVLSSIAQPTLGGGVTPLLMVKYQGKVYECRRAAFLNCTPI